MRIPNAQFCPCARELRLLLWIPEQVIADSRVGAHRAELFHPRDRSRPPPVRIRAGARSGDSGGPNAPRPRTHALVAATAPDPDLPALIRHAMGASQVVAGHRGPCTPTLEGGRATV